MVLDDVPHDDRREGSAAGLYRAAAVAQLVEPADERLAASNAPALVGVEHLPPPRRPPSSLSPSLPSANLLPSLPSRLDRRISCDSVEGEAAPLHDVRQGVCEAARPDAARAGPLWRAVRRASLALLLSLSSLNEEMQGLMPPRVRAQAVRVREVRQAVPEERREEVRPSRSLRRSRGARSRGRFRELGLEKRRLTPSARRRHLLLELC